MTTIKASEVRVGDTILTEASTVVRVTQIDYLDGYVLITGALPVGTIGLPALRADAPVERMSPWQGGPVGGRGERVSDDPDAWTNRRDREDDEPQDIGRRLTEQERYGVSYSGLDALEGGQA